MRIRIRHALPLLLALSCSGGGTGPCLSACPRLEGAYAVSWERIVKPAGCASPEPALLNFSRAGSVAHTTIAGEDLSGTIYDTWDFSLTGGRVDVTYSMHGRVVAADAALDAGMRATGSLVTLTTGDGGTCQAEDNFVADKL